MGVLVCQHWAGRCAGAALCKGSSCWHWHSFGSEATGLVMLCEEKKMAPRSTFSQPPPTRFRASRAKTPEPSEHTSTDTERTNMVTNTWCEASVGTGNNVPRLAGICSVAIATWTQKTTTKLCNSCQPLQTFSNSQ